MTTTSRPYLQPSDQQHLAIEQKSSSSASNIFRTPLSNGNGTYPARSSKPFTSSGSYKKFSPHQQQFQQPQLQGHQPQILQLQQYQQQYFPNDRQR